MKNIFTLLLCMLSLQFISAQERYKLDTEASKLLWKIETVGKHNGYIVFKSGSIDYDSKGLPVGGYFIMDTENIRSTDRATEKGRAEIDQQLKGVAFFNSKTFPTATMRVLKITPTPAMHVYRVSGNLTIKGITNTIEFNATIKKQGTLVTSKADFKIARERWAIDFKKQEKWDIMSALQNRLIADDISISLDLNFAASTQTLR